MWEDFSGKVGFWADMKHPYVTYDNTFIESEWWALKQIWDKGLLYKGFKIVPYCPRCGTPLSSQEVAQGYKDVKERSAVVKFKAKGEEAYFLAWTTTPWTLPSNVALCVNPAEDYVKSRLRTAPYTIWRRPSLRSSSLRESRLSLPLRARSLNTESMSRCSNAQSRMTAKGLVCHLRRLCHSDGRHRYSPYRTGIR